VRYAVSKDKFSDTILTGKDVCLESRPKNCVVHATKSDENGRLMCSVNCYCNETFILSIWASGKTACGLCSYASCEITVRRVIQLRYTLSSIM